jgi:xyloglucan 6-xylosyltransferase
MTSGKRRDVLASAPANLAVPPALEAAMAFPSKQQQPPLPLARQLTDHPNSLGPAMSDYAARRSAWIAAHLGFPNFVAPERPRVLVVTNSSPRRCSDHVLLRAFKSKADYCRVHGSTSSIATRFQHLL